MFATIIAIIVFFVTFVISICLYAYSLIIGLQWSKHENVPNFWKSTLVVLVITAAQLLLLISVAFSHEYLENLMPSYEFVIFILAYILASVIISKWFNISLNRACQAWLPSLVAGAVVFLMTFLFVRPFVYEGFVMSSNSMAPTILGRHVKSKCPECDENAYGMANIHGNDSIDSTPQICDHFHVTDLNDRIFENNQPDRILVSKYLSPRRWDIIAFKKPDEPETTYLKRIVGLPGETIIIKNGQIWVNGKQLVLPDEISGNRYERLGFDKQPVVWATRDYPATLGKNEYFVLGDFSKQSFDSRYWIAGAQGHNPFAVPASHIKGVATHIYWPINRFRVLR